MPNLSMQNYVACAPRGTRATDPCGKYFQWGTSAASTAVAEESVFDAIGAATSQFSIASDKIFIAGIGRNFCGEFDPIVTLVDPV